MSWSKDLTLDVALKTESSRGELKRRTTDTIVGAVQVTDHSPKQLTKEAANSASFAAALGLRVPALAASKPKKDSSAGASPSTTSVGSPCAEYAPPWFTSRAHRWVDMKPEEKDAAAEEAGESWAPPWFTQPAHKWLALKPEEKADIESRAPTPPPPPGSVPSPGSAPSLGPTPPAGPMSQAPDPSSSSPSAEAAAPRETSDAEASTDTESSRSDSERTSSGESQSSAPSPRTRRRRTVKRWAAQMTAQRQQQAVIATMINSAGTGLTPKEAAVARRKLQLSLIAKFETQFRSQVAAGVYGRGPQRWLREHPDVASATLIGRVQQMQLHRQLAQLAVAQSAASHAATSPASSVASTSGVSGLSSGASASDASATDPGSASAASVRNTDDDSGFTSETSTRSASSAGSIGFSRLTMAPGTELNVNVEGLVGFGPSPPTSARSGAGDPSVVLAAASSPRAGLAGGLAAGAASPRKSPRLFSATGLPLGIQPSALAPSKGGLLLDAVLGMPSIQEVAQESGGSDVGSPSSAPPAREKAPPGRPRAGSVTGKRTRRGSRASGALRAPRRRSGGGDGGSPPTPEISPTTGKRKGKRWTSDEDQALRVAVAIYSARNWKGISAMVAGRDHVQCRQRWQKVLRPGLKKGHWTEEEDALLCERLHMLDEQGEPDWKLICKAIKGRTPKQCRERWCSHLDPNVKKGNWQPDDDAHIIRLQAKHGNRWATIAQTMPGRTANDVKIRFQTLSRLSQTSHRSPKTSARGRKAQTDRKRAPQKKDHSSAALKCKQRRMRALEIVKASPEPRYRKASAEPRLRKQRAGSRSRGRKTARGRDAGMPRAPEPLGGSDVHPMAFDLDSAMLDAVGQGPADPTGAEPMTMASFDLRYDFDNPAATTNPGDPDGAGYLASATRAMGTNTSPRDGERKKRYRVSPKSPKGRKKPVAARSAGDRLDSPATARRRSKLRKSAARRAEKAVPHIDVMNIDEALRDFHSGLTPVAGSGSTPRGHGQGRLFSPTRVRQLMKQSGAPAAPDSPSTILADAGWGDMTIDSLEAAFPNHRGQKSGLSRTSPRDAFKLATSAVTPRTARLNRRRSSDESTSSLEIMTTFLGGVTRAVTPRTARLARRRSSDESTSSLEMMKTFLDGVI